MWTAAILPATGKWNDIACRDPKYCILVGDSGRILTMWNGGRSWTKSGVSTHGTIDIVHVQIAPDGTAWAIASARNFGALLSSVDKGVTWEVIGADIVGFWRALFWNSDHGLLFGTNILETRDGGASWTNVLDGPMLRAVYFADATHGWGGG